MKWLATMAVVLLIVVVGSVVYLHGNNNATYVDVADLKGSEPYRQGYIPDFLPASMKNLVESHEEGMRQVRASFSYTPGDSGQLEQACNVLKSDDQSKRYGCDFSHGFIQVELFANGSGVFVMDRKQG